jgi:hypothetical protein
LRKMRGLPNKRLDKEILAMHHSKLANSLSRIVNRI